MRNFNTSLFKNAIRFFANEASNVLRAFADPATTLLRLIQSTVRTILEWAMPKSYRQLRLQQVSEAVVNHGTSEIIDRILSVMSGYGPGGDVHGQIRRDCRLSQTVS